MGLSQSGYRSYDEMIAEEVKKPVGERIDYALIVTPNHVHFDPAMKCIKAGIPVFCEKPLTVTMDESDTAGRSRQAGQNPLRRRPHLLGTLDQPLLHVSSFTSGLIGDVRWVDSYYIQGWLAGRTEDQGVMQAEWRVDPKQAGASCCGGDIGTHALMQLRYITGLDVTDVQGSPGDIRRGTAVGRSFHHVLQIEQMVERPWYEQARLRSVTRMILASKSTVQRDRCCGGKSIPKK